MRIRGLLENRKKKKEFKIWKMPKNCKSKWMLSNKRRHLNSMRSEWPKKTLISTVVNKNLPRPRGTLGNMRIKMTLSVIMTKMMMV